MEVCFFIVLGFAFLVMLALWTTRNTVELMRSDEIAMCETMLADFRAELPPVAMANRIFSIEDWNYITSYSLPDLEQAFLEERKKVARLWIRRTRSGVERLMRLRKAVVRMHRSSKPIFELALGIDYALFLVLSSMLELLIMWRGPFFINNLAKIAFRTAQEFSYICGSAVGSLNAEQRHRMQTNWAA